MDKANYLKRLDAIGVAYFGNASDNTQPSSTPHDLPGPQSANTVQPTTEINS